ncbi:hypothetical protein KIF24_24340 [Micromonospora sp. Llam7]|uniref:hypothetical protein n=1 Tax=Micromonospora tarapacensis TaxID=2835305 RepID=UPI001C82CBDE|nr:hypothetical protein [Micromonospora tarapacensis]MBX7268843.1 hypothetical protein [Micromonospora tarapacensis]
MDWLPEALHPVAMRLARADQLAFELAEIALAWSRGSDDRGPLTLRQVERTPGYLDVEVSTIRPVPPIAAMLFSEVVHHLRSAIDNVVFYLVERNRDAPLTDSQARAVSMLIYEDPKKFEDKVKGLVKQGLTEFATTATLGKRTAALQPFADKTSVPAISPALSMLMGAGPDVANEHPLVLLRDYSNDDKHRTIRLAAGRSLVQRLDDVPRTRQLGMRHIEVGTVLEVVQKGVVTPVDTSPALHVQRPDGGVWVGPGYELDCLSRHVADIVVPTLITGMSLPGGLPAQVDLSDTGTPLAERLRQGGTTRAHDRAREMAGKAYWEAMKRDRQFPPIVAGTVPEQEKS